MTNGEKSKPGADDLLVWFSAAQLAVCTALWPLSVLTFAASEPQTVLHLSWAAIYISALGNLIVARTHRRVGND